MKTVERRLDRLEDRVAPRGKNLMLLVVTDAAQELALDSDRCVQILRDAGLIDSASPISIVDLGCISRLPERRGVGALPPGARCPP